MKHRLRCIKCGKEPKKLWLQTKTDVDENGNHLFSQTVYLYCDCHVVVELI